MRLDDIWFLSDLPFIRLYLPTKSISKSPYLLWDCLPEIHSQVSPYFSETFPKVADLIGAWSLLTSHFLWQDCQTGSASRGHSAVGGHPLPAPFSCTAGSGKEWTPPKPEPCCRVCTETQELRLLVRLLLLQELSGTLCNDPEQLELICMAWTATRPQRPLHLPLPLWFLCRQVRASGGCKGQLAGGL